MSTTKLKRAAVLLLLSLASMGSPCSGGGDGGVVCTGDCPQRALSVIDVQSILARGEAEARLLNAAATIAVVDRLGNVLAVWRMNGAVSNVLITSNRGVTTGLDGLDLVEDPVSPFFELGAALAAISKAGTAAYLSSQGNAFSTRTASQIVQENFNPGEIYRPGGPLFGVQFSQLPCGDIVRRFDVDADLGPKRLPLGLSADPGGLPLYIDGVPVGGVGVELDGVYSTAGSVIFGDSESPEEQIAVAAVSGFEASQKIRGPSIAVDGRYLRYTQSRSIQLDPLASPGFPPANGELLAIPGFSSAQVLSGTLLLSVESGIVDSSVGGQRAEVLIQADGVTNRYPPSDSQEPLPVLGGLSAEEVTEILASALAVAERSRAQIRRPGGQSARVNVAAVDLDGNVLGLARSPDAPIFGIDVSVQKARTAGFLSQPSAAAALYAAAPPLIPSRADPLGNYVDAVQEFLGDPSALANGTAFSDRAGGNLSRPYFPDGVNGNPNGPLSRPFEEWSPFSTGLQLDASFNALLDVLSGLDPPAFCSGVSLEMIANGLQIFPGSVPIFRGDLLVGGLGVSGDGVDQDDLVAFLGLHEAGVELGNEIGNAPVFLRADNLRAGEHYLRFVNCPVTPYLNSSAQNVCGGK